MKIAILDSGCFEHYEFNNKNINIIGDNVGHGSKLASLIFKINPNVEILNFKCVNNLGKANLDNIINGINYAIKNKVDIILLAMGYELDITIFHNAIKEANRKNILIISSAGNDYNKQYYPALYKEVLSVGSYNCNKKRSYFSSVADVYVQGINIKTVDFNNSYNTSNGTSLSSAIVTGLASLILEEKQFKTNKEKLKYLKGVDYYEQFKRYQ